MEVFKPDTVLTYERYSSRAHFENGLSVYISSEVGPRRVRVNAQHLHGGATVYYTPEQARLLAAELIAAADSLAIPVAEVTELEAA